MTARSSSARNGEVFGTFETSEQRSQAGDIVMQAHGKQRFKVLSVIPVERLAEFVGEPVGGMLEVEPL